jgi:hypothetical protein
MRAQVTPVEASPPAGRRHTLLPRAGPTAAHTPPLGTQLSLLQVPHRGTVQNVAVHREA